MLQYKIQYTWPGGEKVRYQAKNNRLTPDWEEALVHTLYEASQQLRRSKTAKLVWDITARKIKV